MSKIKKTKWNIEKIGKIYHVSDIHVRNYKRHQEYKNVFRALYEELKNRITENDIICLTGDIVHSKTDVSPELFHEVQALLKNLCSIGKVLMIPGNHDTNLNNMNRMDALTPIVNALNDENLYYFKDSGVLEIGDCMFYHWSVFDASSKYPKVNKSDSHKNIALYHGLVNNSTTEAGYVLHSDSMKAESFDGFDLVLLGDIHKQQYLNESKTIAYPGSLIQQNHGEDLIHGILVWNIEDFSSEFLEISNDTAFYTVEVNNGLFNPLPNNLPTNLYLRIKYKNTDQSTIKSLVNEIKRDKNIIEVSYQKLYDSSKRENSANNVRGVDFRSVDKQRELLYNYLNSKYKLDAASIQKVHDINDRINAQLPKNEVPRNSMWLPKRFEFENMFSYGKNNHIDFTNMEGTYGLFAPNASGKSTLLDAITYCIFDKCTKSTRGHQVMNSNSNTFYCKLEFELNGTDYAIERNARRQKSGNVRVEVDFYHLDDDGNKVSLNGKERTDTNNNIKNLLGSYDDFILTTLSTQSGNTGFIDMNQKDRKDLLSQFLDIGVFEQMYEAANESSKETMAIVRHHQKNNYDEQLYEKETKIEDIDRQLNSAISNVQGLRNRIKDLNEKRIQLATKFQDVDESVIDETVLLDKKNEAQSMLNDLSVDKSNLKRKEDSLNQDEEALKSSIDEIDEAQLKQREKSISEVKNKINAVNLEIKQIESDIFHKNKKMEQLKELKYDENCKYCMDNIFVKDAINTKSELQKDQSNLQNKKKELSELKEQLQQYGDVDADKRKLLDLKNKLNALVSSQLKLKKDTIDNENSVQKVKSGIQKIDEKLEERKKLLKAIESNNRINQEIEIIKKQAQEADKELKEAEENASKYDREKTVLDSSIKDLKKSINELKTFEQEMLHYQYYLEAVHRDGVPHDLIAMTIPQVEEEVNNILSQLVDFRIILQTDDKNVNAYIAYSEEEYWPIELTSGMEKFVSSLAIRTSLIGISTLPRPNFMAIDEGFGALDKSNLSSMAMLFDYLKTQFKFVMVISHIDSMRDIVDSHIEINKVDGRSNVKHK
jgi:DNA repair exonuclease SbcCD ATPase subunit/predicted phosphohydrolase